MMRESMDTPQGYDPAAFHAAWQESRNLSQPMNSGGYDVSCHCKNYTPAGRGLTFDMSDYRSCDSCIHQRGDLKCGIVQQSLQ